MTGTKINVYDHDGSPKCWVDIEPVVKFIVEWHEDRKLGSAHLTKLLESGRPYADTTFIYLKAKEQ